MNSSAQGSSAQGNKEARARIRINRLLEEAGWRFFPEGNQPANICLEPNVRLKRQDLEQLGDNFEKASRGFIDFLLLDDRGFPLIVLEAKAEDRDPLVGKEQARKYARAQNCRFVLLSNGNLHYFWDLARGNPHLITTFPTPASVGSFQQFTPDPARLVAEIVDADYVVRSQRPGYDTEAAWKNQAERSAFIETNGLRFLRPYQLNAIHALQAAAKQGKDRFLFEMATGTGKTLVSAAIIRLFLRTRNARRVLFLVDRLELEDQGKKALARALGNDYQTVVYKESRDDWRRADIVVSTVQSLLFNNKYQAHFSPTDFDLVISDEAHRSISGNARAVFDYFVGYKLGLTATPRAYLRNYSASPDDPRAFEQRLLLDTYRIFGCEESEPTFRYGLDDGVRDGFLINPIVADARTDVTTRLLSDEGFVLPLDDSPDADPQEAFRQRDFERTFFSDETNRLFCSTFLQHALRDPISGEIGKSIVFAVSQNHAAKLTQTLNLLADRLFPGRYQSDFAVQVTSQIADAQLFTTQFANNNLLGSGNFLPTYRTSKARVCVTVGMMTTGYDCPDLLNLGLFRPIFSPTDFIQIKGRGTRRHNFLRQLQDDDLHEAVAHPEKQAFKLFDFFANCEYFEKEHNYDEVIPLPRPSSERVPPIIDPPVIDPVSQSGTYSHLGRDQLTSFIVHEVGPEGMKVDRMFFNKFSETVRSDPTLAAAVEAGQWERAINHLTREILNKPREFFTLDKLRRAIASDRRLSPREILEYAFGRIPAPKTKAQLLEAEFDRFLADAKPSADENIPALRHFFNAYVSSDQVRTIVEGRRFAELSTNPVLTPADLRAVPETYRTRIPQYVKDYVHLNLFMD